MIAVTQVIDLLNKPALLKWANKIGLEGYNLTEYRNSVKKDGTNRHQQLEQYFKEGEVFEGCEILEQTLQGYEVIGVEQQVEGFGMIGRVDLILRKGEDIIIVDFKSGLRAYLNTKLQLSAYAYMYGASKVAFMNTNTLQLQQLRINVESYFKIVQNLVEVKIALTNLNETL